MGVIARIAALESSDADAVRAALADLSRALGERDPEARDLRVVGALLAVETEPGSDADEARDACTLALAASDDGIDLLVAALAQKVPALCDGADPSRRAFALVSRAATAFMMTRGFDERAAPVFARHAAGLLGAARAAFARLTGSDRAFVVQTIVSWLARSPFEERHLPAFAELVEQASDELRDPLLAYPLQAFARLGDAAAPRLARVIRAALARTSLTSVEDALGLGSGRILEIEGVSTVVRASAVLFALPGGASLADAVVEALAPSAWTQEMFEVLARALEPSSGAHADAMAGLHQSELAQVVLPRLAHAGRSRPRSGARASTRPAGARKKAAKERP